MDKQKEMINEKLGYYLNSDIKIHITKINKEFLNGFIYMKGSEGVYYIREDKLGNIRVFVSEIFDIEEFREKGENKNA